MELEGSLKAFSLPEILQFLSIGKMTGTLSVSASSRTINLMIRSGRIINSSSFQTGRKLGSMLVHHGLLKRRELQEALRVQREGGEKRLLGRILVEENFISERDLHDHISMQLQEEVWDLFRLTEGDFKFEHGQPQQMRDIQIEIEIEPLIIEGTRQLDEWHRIIKNIPGDEYVVRLAKVDSDFEPIPLTDEEWKVLSYINDRLTIGAIVAKSTIGKFETYNNLNTFLSAGMIELRKDAGTGGDKNKAQMDEFVIPMGGGPPIRLDEKKGGDSPNLINRYFSGDPAQAKEIQGKYFFMSPVGQLAHFVNLFAAKLWKSNDFVPSPEDGVMLEKRWNALLNDYFTADGVTVSENFVDASACEKFIGYFGAVADAVRPSYEESILALSEMLRFVVRFAVERVGQRTANSMRDELLGEFAARSIFRVEDEQFDLRRVLSGGAA